MFIKNHLLNRDSEKLKNYAFILSSTFSGKKSVFPVSDAIKNWCDARCLFIKVCNTNIETSIEKQIWLFSPLEGKICKMNAQNAWPKRMALLLGTYVNIYLKLLLPEHIFTILNISKELCSFFCSFTAIHRPVRCPLRSQGGHIAF